MKILAFGDTHIGAGTEYGRALTGGDSRLADQERVLDEIVGVAFDNAVDLVLFAGDAFHRRRPSPAELLAFQRPLNRLAGELQVIGIPGNHDVIGADQPMGLEVFHNGDPLSLDLTPNVTCIGDVAICTLPWVSPARIVASRNGGDRDVIHTDVAQLLVDAAAEQRAQCPPGLKSILLAHWSVSGASTPSGVPTDAFREPVIPLGDLAALGFDYVVLGHIHRAQELRYVDSVTGALPGRIFYVGSPACVDFGEAAVEHGCWLIDTDRGSAEFQALNDRPFVTIDLTGDEAEGWCDAEREDSATDYTMPSVATAVVRLRYTATAEQARHIDHNALKRVLYDSCASKVYGIFPTIVREDRARVDGLDDQVSELDALDLWLESNEINGDRANVLRERTAAYLEGSHA